MFPRNKLSVPPKPAQPGEHEFERMNIFLVLIFVLFPSALALAGEFQKPGTAEVNGVSKMVLIYHGNSSRLAWTPEMILPYVAHVDDKGKPTDWLFDSFLFTEFVTDNGASLHHYAPGGEQATAKDWAWLADGWFREKTGLIGLDGAVANAEKILGDTNHQVNVVIALPIPFQPITNFGPFPNSNQKYNFSKDQDRLAALQWYVARVRDHWQHAKYSHLKLAGFYWTDETIPPENEKLVRAFSESIHERNLKLFWIPFFTPQGLDRWKQLGIDGTMLQPNYFFHPEITPDRFLHVAQKTQVANCGVEMEFDRRVFRSQSWEDRFWTYLDAGAKYGWMTNSLLGFYEGNNGLHLLATRPGEARKMYDALYRFVKGTYQFSGKTKLADFQPPKMSPPPMRHAKSNLALAANGAKVLGGERPEGAPELAPENAIDGVIDNYGGQGGFAYFPLGQSMTIELPKKQNIARSQMLLWDLDGRWFQYRIETSPDNNHWQIAVDKTRGEWSGWQVDNFPPREAKYVRLTGKYNSLNSNFQIVEMEIYSQRSDGQ